MSDEEIRLLRDSTFEEIWDNIWNKVRYVKPYEEEYLVAANKYNSLREKYQKENILGLSYYVNHISPEWRTPEWGFPKGRRSYHEKNMECALREFTEETAYLNTDHEIIEHISPIKEIFFGTNKVLYKHVYFLSILTNHEKELKLDESNLEIGDIGWYTYSEAIKLIRPYHVEKKNILNNLFKWIASVIDS